jgi:hypothetical protein
VLKLNENFPLIVTVPDTASFSLTPSTPAAHVRLPVPLAIEKFPSMLTSPLTALSNQTPYENSWVTLLSVSRIEKLPLIVINESIVVTSSK